jgi:hypothetical protein
VSPESLDSGAQPASQTLMPEWELGTTPYSQTIVAAGVWLPLGSGASYLQGVPPCVVGALEQDQYLRELCGDTWEVVEIVERPDGSRYQRTPSRRGVLPMDSLDYLKPLPMTPGGDQPTESEEISAAVDGPSAPVGVQVERKRALTGQASSSRHVDKKRRVTEEAMDGEESSAVRSPRGRVDTTVRSTEESLSRGLLSPHEM